MKINPLNLVIMSIVLIFMAALIADSNSTNFKCPDTIYIIEKVVP